MLRITPEDQFTTKIFVHPSQRTLHVEPISQPLYIIGVIFNPERYATKYRNFWAYEKHIRDSGAQLYVVELALRDRHFQITSYNNPNHIQLRTDSELFSKENLINIGIRHLPQNWLYAGYVDCDFMMTRSDWVYETLHQLQHFSWVQIFSSYSDLAQNYTLFRTMPSFQFVHHDPDTAKRILRVPGQDNQIDNYYLTSSKEFKPIIGATGGAWTWRREAYNAVGGLLDFCILGSADFHMAFALNNKINWASENTRCTPQYIEALKRWADKAKQFEYKVGYIENHAIHSFHGSKVNRNYGTRWEILQRFDYNPLTDIDYDDNGVLKFTGNKPGLEAAIRNYFRLRKEDS
jgi:hypothetical protein